MAAAPIATDPPAGSQELHSWPPSRLTRLVGRHWRAQRWLSEVNRYPGACESWRSVALPATSDRPARRSCPAAPLALPSATPPISLPRWFPLVPPELRTHAPHKHHLSAPATLYGPAFRSQSKADDLAEHMLPAPYTPATSWTAAPAAAPLPLSPHFFHFPRFYLRRCSRPPAVSRLLHPPAPLPQLPAHR